jgi:hypothetical protein
MQLSMPPHRQVGYLIALLLLLCPIAVAAPALAEPVKPVTYVEEFRNLAGEGYDIGPVEINGVDYEHGLSHWRDTSGEYNLARRYGRLRATIGVLDTATWGASVTFEVWLDGVRVYTKQIAIGEDASFSLDVTRMLRLRLVLRGVDDGETAAWADAHLTA